MWGKSITREFLLSTVCMDKCVKVNQLKNNFCFIDSLGLNAKSQLWHYPYSLFLHARTSCLCERERSEREREAFLRPRQDGLSLAHSLALSRSLPGAFLFPLCSSPFAHAWQGNKFDMPFQPVWCCPVGLSKVATFEPILKVDSRFLVPLTVYWWFMFEDGLQKQISITNLNYQ